MDHCDTIDVACWDSAVILILLFMYPEKPSCSLEWDELVTSHLLSKKDGQVPQIRSVVRKSAGFD